MNSPGSERQGKRLPWWHEGIRFECTGCGACCLNHGPYTYVFVDAADRRRLAAFLGLAPAVFTRRHCLRVGQEWVLRDPPGSEACVYFEAETKRCLVYESRPEQCRSFPFWPEVMDRKVWERDVAGFCEGVGRGPVIDGAEIARRLAGASD